MLADRQGRYAFTGTPQGMNNLLYDVYEDALELSQTEPEQCALFVYPASKTGYVPPEELEKARASMGDAEYLQEFECSFAAAVRGAYWAREIDALEQLGRVTSVPIAAQLPVNTAWDLHLGALALVHAPGVDERLVGALALDRHRRVRHPRPVEEGLFRIAHHGHRELPDLLLARLP